MASSGDIFLDGERVNNTKAADRGLAMVFQSYALYPHMTVRENMSFALKYAKVPKDEITLKNNAALNHFVAIEVVSSCLQSLKKA